MSEDFKTTWSKSLGTIMRTDSVTIKPGDFTYVTPGTYKPSWKGDAYTIYWPDIRVIKKCETASAIPDNCICIKLRKIEAVFEYEGRALAVADDGADWIFPVDYDPITDRWLLRDADGYVLEDNFETFLIIPMES